MLFNILCIYYRNFYGSKKEQEHRCTRVENTVEGVPEVFARIPGGGAGFQKKLPGGSPYFGFYTFIAFLLTSVLKFAWGWFYV